MKKVLAFSLIAFVASLTVFMVYEPSGSKAASTTQDVTVSETVDADITLAVTNSTIDLGNIPGISGGTKDSSLTKNRWTVTTNNATGWKLEMHSNNTGKLQHGAGGTNDEFARFNSGTIAFWNTTTVPAGTAAYGFTASGDSSGTGYTFVETAFKDDGAACGASTGLGSCFSALNASGSKVQFAHRDAASELAGDWVETYFKTQMRPASGFYLNSGSYTSTVTGTATTL
jgi:hypothetical protein